MYKHSEYFYTFTGQLEFYLLALLRAAQRNARPPLPIYFSGAANAIDLYLDHPSYSPFVKPWNWSKDDPLMVADWDLRRHLIDDRLMTTEEWTEVLKKEFPQLWR